MIQYTSFSEFVLIMKVIVEVQHYMYHCANYNVYIMQISQHILGSGVGSIFEFG